MTFRICASAKTLNFCARRVKGDVRKVVFSSLSLSLSLSLSRSLARSLSLSLSLSFSLSLIHVFTHALSLTSTRMAGVRTHTCQIGLITNGVPKVLNFATTHSDALRFQVYMCLQVCCANVYVHIDIYKTLIYTYKSYMYIPTRTCVHACTHTTYVNTSARSDSNVDCVESCCETQFVGREIHHPKMRIRGK
jgi:hypothetical protein